MTATTTTMTTASITPEGPAPAAAPGRTGPRLGEELPIFCERCGYSLHGLPQCRCGACTLLHFTCPECNHRQPINTLRPAVQRAVGRVRAAVVVLLVLFKLNWFGWLLFAWFGMGVEWSYAYNFIAINAFAAPLIPYTFDGESVLAFTLFALPFGLFSRLLLLRWRSGWKVGLVLAALVVAAVLAGARFRMSFDSMRGVARLGTDFYLLALLAAAAVIAGAMLAWPACVMLVRAFVPARAGAALLDWQRSLCEPRPDPASTRRLDAPAAA